jgi:hypothetical protein
VRDTIGEWHGDDPGLSRRWVEEAVAAVDDGDRAAARLALLTALAPSQVDAAILDDFRRRHPGDATLIAAAAWASFTVTRRIGSWLTVPA